MESRKAEPSMPVRSCGYEPWSPSPTAQPQVGYVPSLLPSTSSILDPRLGIQMQRSLLERWTHTAVMQCDQGSNSFHDSLSLGHR